MGNWYRVVKTIKGHRYAYMQQTYREGAHVRTLNRYVGRLEEGGELGKLAGLDASLTTTKALTEKERTAWSNLEPWVRDRLSNDEAGSNEEMIADFVKEGHMTRKEAENWVSKRGFFLEHIVFDDGSVYDLHKRRALFSSPADFGRAVVEQVDPPKWGEDVRDQLLGGGGGRPARRLVRRKADASGIAHRSLGGGGRRKAVPFNFGRSVAYDEAGKRRFHARARARLRLLAGELGLMPGDYTLSSNMGGIAVSGEVTLHSDNLYVNVSQSVMGDDAGVLFRTCKGRVDYRGGQNHFAPIHLLNNPVELSKRIREGLAEETPVTTTVQGGEVHERAVPGGYTPRDVQKEITDKIIEAIESGRDTGSFQMPWRAIASEGLPVNAVTHQPYHGANVLYLCLVAMHNKWPNHWASFQQWKEHGASVRKGEHGVPIVFYSHFNVTDVEEDEEGNVKPVVKQIPVFRYSTVFNIAQVDNPPEGVASASAPLADPVKRNEAVEQFISSTKADIFYGGNRAFFSTGGDFINIPPREAFTGTKTSSPTEAFYSTVLHELCHWTGGWRRLNRENHNKFGDEAYAKEELVAEIGAAIACATLGVTPELREDHVQYVSSWLKILKEDKRAIFTAAARASRAVEYLESLQGQAPGGESPQEGEVTTTARP